MAAINYRNGAAAKALSTQNRSVKKIARGAAPTRRRPSPPPSPNTAPQDSIVLLGLTHLIDPSANTEDLLTEALCHLEAAHQIGELLSLELYNPGSQTAANPRDASLALGGMNSLLQLALSFVRAAGRRQRNPFQSVA
jgi:hypothetical protein